VPLGVALAGVYSLDVSPIGDWRSPEPDLSDARQIWEAPNELVALQSTAPTQNHLHPQVSGLGGLSFLRQLVSQLLLLSSLCVRLPWTT
jgi:hypothetical protein